MDWGVPSPPAQLHMLKILSNLHLFTNEIKSLKFYNSAQSSSGTWMNR